MLLKSRSVIVCLSIRGVRGRGPPSASGFAIPTPAPPSSVAELKVSESKKKALNVAVIGPPNVGKSALTNMLIRADVCAVSKRMDTTRNNTVTALTEHECQLVVVDSPGLVGIKHARDVVGAHGDAALLADPEKAITRADHLLIIHDATLPGRYLSHRLLHLLHRHSHLSASLVINKIDLIHRQSDVLELGRLLTNGIVGGQAIQTAGVKLGKLGSVAAKSELKLHGSHTDGKDEKWKLMYQRLLQKPTHKVSWGETKKLFGTETGWPNFDRLFFVSAITGRGIDELRSHLQQVATPVEGDFALDENAVTAKRPKQLVAEHVRSEILNALPGDVAYNLRVNVIEWNGPAANAADSDTPLEVVVDVDCDKRRWAELLAAVVPQIEKAVADHLRNLFGLESRVAVRPKHAKEVVGVKVKAAN
uniref:G domain-containing protein n=1 Tax=Panagrellus redivivus TaxID=6233 RepID=A0A7E5A284_PANRE